MKNKMRKRIEAKAKKKNNTKRDYNKLVSFSSCTFLCFYPYLNGKRCLCFTAHTYHTIENRIKIQFGGLHFQTYIRAFRPKSNNRISLLCFYFAYVTGTSNFSFLFLFFTSIFLHFNLLLSPFHFTISFKFTHRPIHETFVLCSILKSE